MSNHKFSVGVPKDLHRELVRKAVVQGVSLNLLGRGIGKTTTSAHLT